MAGAEIWPAHAYVPGISPRHPEGTFDEIRQTAKPGMTVEELGACPSFRHGLRYIDAGFYWEAHEVLEPVWLALPKDSAERRLVQGLIQLANGFLKLRMQRPKAAIRLAQLARGLLPAAAGPQVLGVDPLQLDQRLHDLLMRAKEQYNAQNLG